MIIENTCMIANSNGDARNVGQSIFANCSRYEMHLSGIYHNKGTGEWSPSFWVEAHSLINEINESDNTCANMPTAALKVGAKIIFSSFYSNTATDGRIIYYADGNESICFCNFIKNEVNREGVVFSEGMSNISIIHCSFVQNTADYFFFIHNRWGSSSMYVHNCSIANNNVNSLSYFENPSIIDTSNIENNLFKNQINAYVDCTMFRTFNPNITEIIINYSQLPIELFRMNAIYMAY